MSSTAAPGSTESPPPSEDHPTLLPPDPPLALPAPPSQPPSTTNPRRLPPPCWSPDETVALIDAYRDKWYQLRRSNLKANHWQEVADAVALRCPGASLRKTAVQCRHKMEKLRKRYRTEIQRARSMPVSRFNSSWVHFKRMDSMEKGPQTKTETYNPSVESDDGEDNDDDGDVNNDDEDENHQHQHQHQQQQGFYPGSYKNGSSVMNTRSIHRLYRNGFGNSGGSLSGLGSGAPAGSGFRIRIPTGVSIAQPGLPEFYAKVDPKYVGNPGLGSNANVKPMNAAPNFGGVPRGGEEMGKKREREPMEEMVAAIKVLGDGFVRMEQMKMEMAREIETMRMEMEMKRTEMILESQQRIVEAFAKAFLEKKKKPKRMPSPES